jgi:hypothetical protein
MASTISYCLPTRLSGTWASHASGTAGLQDHAPDRALRLRVDALDDPISGEPTQRALLERR